MKCFEVTTPSMNQFNFNYAVIRTRRVVECAFGRLKGRFPILVSTRLSNPLFAADVSLCCCGLHNYIERRGGLGAVLPLDRWVPPVPSDLNQQRAAGGAQARAAIDKRNILASYVKGRLNATPAQYNQHAYAAVLYGPVGFQA